MVGELFGFSTGGVGGDDDDDDDDDGSSCVTLVEGSGACVWTARKRFWPEGHDVFFSLPARLPSAIGKALELNESLTQAHSELAGLKTWSDWDWPSAERAFERAIELNPSNAYARTLYSHFLNIMGRPDEAMAQIERALG